MAKRKIQFYIEIQNEKEFYNNMKQNADQLICAEIFNHAFGFCSALDRLFSNLKLEWTEGELILLKVPADEIESLERFRGHSEPVFMFIREMKVTRVFRGVDPGKVSEVTKKEMAYYVQERNGECPQRRLYEINEPTADEEEWLRQRTREREHEMSEINKIKAKRQAERKKHRALLMVPYLKDLNFVIFWPHSVHAHRELYERWDANDIIMVGLEEYQITEENISDVFYAGDAPLNEASVNVLYSAPSLAICFRILEENDNFVALVRKILYQDLPQYDENKTAQDQKPPLKTAFDYYKTYSLTREQIWQQRRQEWQRKKEELADKRARRLSEMQRLARQAIEDALEERRQAKENRKLELHKIGDLATLDQLKLEPDDTEVDIIVPEELSDEEVEEEELVEDENEYFPPPGLLIPGFYAPPNEIAKANGLAVLFPNHVLERVAPTAEFLPPHLLVLLEITKRHRAIDAIRPYKSAVINMGIFKGISPYNSSHIAYTVKQFDTLDINSMNLDEICIAFMISMETDVALLNLMDLCPIHVSKDIEVGEDECAAMFDVDYADDYDQYEDF